MLLRRLKYQLVRAFEEWRVIATMTVAKEQQKEFSVVLLRKTLLRLRSSRLLCALKGWKGLVEEQKYVENVISRARHAIIAGRRYWKHRAWNQWIEFSRRECFKLEEKRIRHERGVERLTMWSFFHDRQSIINAFKIWSLKVHEMCSIESHENRKKKEQHEKKMGKIVLWWTKSLKSGAFCIWKVKALESMSMKMHFARLSNRWRSNLLHKAWKRWNLVVVKSREREQEHITNFEKKDHARDILKRLFTTRFLKNQSLAFCQWKLITQARCQLQLQLRQQRMSALVTIRRLLERKHEHFWEKQKAKCFFMLKNWNDVTKIRIVNQRYRAQSKIATTALINSQRLIAVQKLKFLFSKRLAKGLGVRLRHWKRITEVQKQVLLARRKAVSLIYHIFIRIIQEKQKESTQKAWKALYRNAAQSVANQHQKSIVLIKASRILHANRLHSVSRAWERWIQYAKFDIETKRLSSIHQEITRTERETTRNTKNHFAAQLLQRTMLKMLDFRRDCAFKCWLDYNSQQILRQKRVSMAATLIWNNAILVWGYKSRIMAISKWKRHTQFVRNVSAGIQILYSLLKRHIQQKEIKDKGIAFRKLAVFANSWKMMLLSKQCSMKVTQDVISEALEAEHSLARAQDIRNLRMAYATATKSKGSTTGSVPNTISSFQAFFQALRLFAKDEEIADWIVNNTHPRSQVDFKDMTKAYRYFSSQSLLAPQNYQLKQYNRSKILETGHRRNLGSSIILPDCSQLNRTLEERMQKSFKLVDEIMFPSFSHQLQNDQTTMTSLSTNKVTGIDSQHAKSTPQSPQSPQTLYDKPLTHSDLNTSMPIQRISCFIPKEKRVGQQQASWPHFTIDSLSTPNSLEKNNSRYDFTDLALTLSTVDTMRSSNSTRITRGFQVLQQILQEHDFMKTSSAFWKWQEFVLNSHAETASGEKIEENRISGPPKRLFASDDSYINLNSHRVQNQSESRSELTRRYLQENSQLNQGEFSDDSLYAQVEKLRQQGI